MAIAVVANDRDVSPLINGLRNKLKDTSVIHLTPDHLTSLPEVKFAIVWQPFTGLWQLLPNLQLVSSLGAGADAILNDTTLGQEVAVVRIVDQGLSVQMAEYLHSVILMKARTLDLYWQQHQSLLWQPQPQPQLRQKKIAILGLGQIGQYIAKYFVNIGYSVKGWSRSLKSIAGVRAYSGPDGLLTSVSDVDFVISILPATNETNDLLNKDVFNVMANHSCLINVGRGQAVNEIDLIYALEQQQIASAVLDVVKQEPLPKSSPLWQCQNLLITPHIAAITDQDEIIEQVAENYRNLCSNKPFNHQINRFNGY